MESEMTFADDQKKKIWQSKKKNGRRRGCQYVVNLQIIVISNNGVIN